MKFLCCVKEAVDSPEKYKGETGSLSLVPQAYWMIRAARESSRESGRRLLKVRNYAVPRHNTAMSCCQCMAPDWYAG